MAKKPALKKRPSKQPAKPSTPKTVVVEDVEQLVEKTFGGKLVLVSSDQPTPATSANDRKMQILRSFFAGIDFDVLEEDVTQLQELQMIVNRRGDDDASAAVDRVIKLLETLQDTGETCGLNSTK